jgi:hypothetical protein
MVPTEQFVMSMSKHWTGTLQNHLTPELRTVWTVMADTFNSVLTGDRTSKWWLINPETGTGKTQGAYLYLGMLGKAIVNHRFPDATGALLVCRTTRQCDEAVAEINGHAGSEVAITKHSKNSVKLSDTQAYPILVITHEAFVRSVEKVDGKLVGVWHVVSKWTGGRRSLTIVDESLTNVVEHHIVSLTDVYSLLGDIPYWVRNNFPNEDEVLDRIATIIKGSRKPRLEGKQVYLQWKEREFDLPPELDWDALADELSLALKKGRGSTEVIKAKLQRHLDTLRDIEGITNSWCYQTNKSGETVLTSSRFKIPEDVPGPVVLDATASQDVVSYLLGDDRVGAITLPRSRSYKNVKLHVARTAPDVGVGKNKMYSNRTKRSEALMRTLTSMDRGNKWLVVCHKDVEPHVLKEKPDNLCVSVGHWGNIDGKNDWNDHDNVVIFGLSYRDEVWSNNAILSVKGDITEETVVDAKASEMNKVLHNRVLAADVIQAVNRIRCRKVIDGEGNCPTADVWIVLPSNAQGDYILQALQQEMPEVNVVDWNYDIERGEQVEGIYSVGEGSFADAVVSYLVNANPGEYLATVLCHRLGFDEPTTTKFKKHLKDPTTALRTRLSALGMNVYVKGKGRGSKTFIFRPYELNS